MSIGSAKKVFFSLLCVLWPSARALSGRRPALPQKTTAIPKGRQSVDAEKTDISAWRTGEHDGRPSDRTAPVRKLVSIVPQRFQDLKMFPTANLTSNKGGGSKRASSRPAAQLRIHHRMREKIGLHDLDSVWYNNIRFFPKEKTGVFRTFQ